MDARIESIIQDVSSQWPYQTQARTRLKVFLDKLLDEEKNREDTRLIIDFELIREASYKQENRLKMIEVSKAVLEFNELGFFVRLWRYFTTNIAKTLTLYRISSLARLRSILDTESIFNIRSLEWYESSEKGLSWFVRFITPSYPGLKQAIDEMKQEHSQNESKVFHLGQEIIRLQHSVTEHVNLYMQLSPSLFDLENELVHYNRLLAWDGNGNQPEGPTKSDDLTLTSHKNSIMLQWSKPTHADLVAKFSQDGADIVVAKTKADLAFREILEQKVVHFRTKYSLAQGRIVELKKAIAEKKSDVSSHLYQIDEGKQRAKHQKAQTSLDRIEYDLIPRLLSSVFKQHQRSSDNSQEVCPPPRSSFSS